MMARCGGSKDVTARVEEDGIDGMIVSRPAKVGRRYALNAWNDGGSLRNERHEIFARLACWKQRQIDCHNTDEAQSFRALRHIEA